MYLIDLDGTMFKNDKAIDGAINFIQYLVTSNLRFLFVSNNALRTQEQLYDYMNSMGFQGIKKEDFFTSGMAAARYVARKDSKRNAYCLGGDGLRQALNDNSFHLVDKNADFVFVGLDTEADYARYSLAVNQLYQGASLIACNRDRVLAHKDGYQLANGSIVAMLEYASKQQSIKLGKPYSPMLEEILRYIHIDKKEIVMIGDNLETDVAFGKNHGIVTIFVTTGVHDENDITRLDIHPDCIIHNLSELI